MAPSASPAPLIDRRALLRGLAACGTPALADPGRLANEWHLVHVPRDQPPVQDQNNAVDGDMFIATALIRAGRQWGRADHLLAAAAIGHDILRLLERTVGPFTVLLPGIQGFETADAIIVNRSYYASR